MPAWDVRFDLHIALGDPEMADLVARVAPLAGVIRSLPVAPDLRTRLDALNIRRAVRGTTGIEGIEVTEDEVQRILAVDSRVLPPGRAQVEREVRNAARAMAFISAELVRDASRPLTEATIAHIHTLITDGVAYPHNTPGVYRSHGVSAGSYVAPQTHVEVVRLMAEFGAWLAGPARALPAPVRAIAAHFYFISVHPFGDGNGRTARAIESYLLYQAELNVLGFYSLANFYYQHREEYIRLLGHVRFETNGNLTPFIAFGLRGLLGELMSVQNEVTGAMAVSAFRDFAYAQLVGSRASRTKGVRRQYELVAGLIDAPVRLADIRIGAHPLGRLYRNMTTMTLRRDIEALSAANLIRVEGGMARANLGRVRGE